MRLKKLELINFRNHKHLSLELEQDFTFFFGNNGVGKTNILEAIFYLSYLKSFRTAQTSSLIRHGQTEALVRADFTDQLGLLNTIAAKVGKKKLFLSMRRRSRPSPKFLACLKQSSSCNETIFWLAPGRTNGDGF